jgi:hypothetical protein
METMTGTIRHDTGAGRRAFSRHCCRSTAGILACLFLVLFLGAGCAGPRYRIAANPEAFNRLSPEEQQRVHAGRVELGDSPVVVELAFGAPDRVSRRRDGRGRTEVWTYVLREYRSRPYLRPWYRYDPLWWDPWYPGMDLEREVLRVEFRDGAVVAVEQEEP